MIDERKEILARLLQDSLAGIESESVIERIVGQVTLRDGKLIKIDRDCYQDENGGIRKKRIVNIGTYVCGCRVDGQSNFGGVDYKGNLTCKKHFYRCVRCRRPLSTKTVKSIDGYCYCGRCYWIVKIRRFLGLRK